MSSWTLPKQLSRILISFYFPLCWPLAKFGIWLIPLEEDRQSTYFTKSKEKKNPWIDLLLPAGTVAEKNSTFVAASASSASSS